MSDLEQAEQTYVQYRDELISLESEIQETINQRYGHELERRRSLLNTARKDLADIKRRELKERWRQLAR